MIRKREVYRYTTETGVTVEEAAAIRYVFSLPRGWSVIVRREIRGEREIRECNVNV